MKTYENPIARKQVLIQMDECSSPVFRRVAAHIRNHKHRYGRYPAVDFLVFLVIIIPIGIRIINIIEKSVTLFGNRLYNRRPVRRDTTVFEKLPKLLCMLEGVTFMLVIVGSFEHEELSKQLVRVGNRIDTFAGFFQFGGGGGTNAGNFCKITRDLGCPPSFHCVIRNLRTPWIISFFCFLRWGIEMGRIWFHEREKRKQSQKFGTQV